MFGLMNTLQDILMPYWEFRIATISLLLGGRLLDFEFSYIPCTIGRSTESDGRRGCWFPLNPLQEEFISNGVWNSRVSFSCMYLYGIRSDL